MFLTSYNDAHSIDIHEFSLRGRQFVIGYYLRAAVAIALGVAGAGFAFWSAYTPWQFASDGVSCRGTVLEYCPSKLRRRAQHYVVHHHRVWYEGCIGLVDLQRRYPPGTAVPLAYLKSDPTSVLFAPAGASWLGLMRSQRHGVLVLFFGSAFAIYWITDGIRGFMAIRALREETWSFGRPVKKAPSRIVVD